MSIQFSYETLLQQEKDLVFPSFDCDAAHKLGMMLIERARRENKVIVVSISIARQTIFHYALGVLGPNSDNWLRRKANVVYEYHRSSLNFGTKLAMDNSSLEYQGRNPADFTVIGGGFPIRVKGLGVIGVVAVTGMPHVEDHEYVTTAIAEYLSNLNA